jgi:hypothetical protein
MDKGWLRGLAATLIAVASGGCESPQISSSGTGAADGVTAGTGGGGGVTAGTGGGGGESGDGTQGAVVPVESDVCAFSRGGGDAESQIASMVTGDEGYLRGLCRPDCTCNDTLECRSNVCERDDEGLLEPFCAHCLGPYPLTQIAECEYQIPRGICIDALSVLDCVSSTLVLRGASRNDCFADSTRRGGWYFTEDSECADHIVLCPSVCERYGGTTEAELAWLVGCF